MKRQKVENNVNLSLTGTNSGVFSYIFEQIDIVEEILFKLPIKCVFRCKGVCKSWKDLISRPNFSKIYAKRSPCTWIVGARYFGNNELFVNERYCGNNLFLLQIEGVDAIESRCNLNRDSLTEPIDIDVVRSCNGLCCLIESYNMSQNVTICNPLTGECKSFSTGKFGNSGYKFGLDYDFGYGPSTDKYKVVRMGETGTDTPRFFGQILTVGVDKNWREIEDPSFVCGSRYSSVYFDGRIHITFCTSIYAFNVDEEKGQCIQYPPSLMHLYCAKLFELDGLLCMLPAPDEYLPIYLPHLQIDIWVMKQYGVVESWTKQITLRDSISHGVDYLLTPFTRLKDGRLLFCSIDSTNLVAYDQKEEKQNEVSCNFDESFTFVPCFALLKDVIVVEASDDTTTNPSQNSS